jgi:hypothetical protein
MQLDGIKTCSGPWYETHWTIYWNDDNTTIVTPTGCSKWNAVLAFSFVVAFLWLASAFLVSAVVLLYEQVLTQSYRVCMCASNITHWAHKRSLLQGKITVFGIRTLQASISNIFGSKVAWWKKPKEGDLERDEPVTTQTERPPQVGQT